MVAVLATILGVFVAGVLISVERIRRDVSKHEATDAALIQRVTALEKDVSEIKSDLKSANSKLDILVGRQSALN